MPKARETILVVHQEEHLRAHACRALRAAGYTAISAAHGVEAQWCVERHAGEVDLLLIDLSPPAGGDNHLGIPLSALWPHTPVIFTSGQGRAESIRQGLLHPRAPFLQKPFAPYVLTRTVRSVLDRWSGLSA